MLFDFRSNNGRLTKNYYVIMSLLLFQLGLINTNEVEADPSFEERYRLAGHPATKADEFNALSLDEDASIRKRVASNRKTPKVILKRLASDPDQSVKISVATNLSSPDDVYPILARDSMIAVRSVVARFEYVPVVALEILSVDKDVDIRLEVARNLNSTKSVLLKLKNDPDNSVQAVAGQALQRLLDEEKQQ